MVGPELASHTGFGFAPGELGPLGAEVEHHVAEIGDITRFPSARHLCAWAGLTPTVRSSDAKARLGHSSRLASGVLRWALVEAAQRNIQGEGPLAETFERIADRRGRQIAKVAVARKILTSASTTCATAKSGA